MKISKLMLMLPIFCLLFSSAKADEITPYTDINFATNIGMNHGQYYDYTSYTTDNYSYGFGACASDYNGSSGERIDSWGSTSAGNSTTISHKEPTETASCSSTIPGASSYYYSAENVNNDGSYADNVNLFLRGN